MEDKITLIRAEIERLKKEARMTHSEYFEGISDASEELLSFIDSLQSENEHTEQPKHSYFTSVYHVGTEPTWKVGDIIAVYEFYSDYEGEHVYGEVEKVEFDEECEDWKYLFSDDDFAYENELITEQAYRKNNGK